jgi:RNA polymerase sigma factor (sigma-70 family)
LADAAVRESSRAGWEKADKLFFAPPRVKIAGRVRLSLCSQVMDRVIELVPRYQHAENEAEREAAAVELLSEIYAPLKAFVNAHAAKGSEEDVLQEVLAAIFTGLWLFEGETAESFWAWAYQIARRKCADSFRGTKMRLMTTADPKLLEEALAHLQDDQAPSAAVLADLRNALNLLKASDYPCLGWLWGRFVLGLSYEELGRQEGITTEAARKRVVRCLKLAEELGSQ